MLFVLHLVRLTGLSSNPINLEYNVTHCHIIYDNTKRVSSLYHEVDELFCPGTYVNLFFQTAKLATTSISFFFTGGRYMVVDCGGGTVDITVHEITNKEGQLKELFKATGGPYGSISKKNRINH